MPIKEIPKTYVYSCDICKAEHKQDNNARLPNDWGNLIFSKKQKQETFTYHEKLLCAACADKFAVINKEFL